MLCRPGCGACCSEISIRDGFFGMPDGKPAGVVCVHLMADFRCSLFADPRRPACCDAFAAEATICGSTREQALVNLRHLEILTLAG